MAVRDLTRAGPAEPGELQLVCNTRFTTARGIGRIGIEMSPLTHTRKIRATGQGPGQGLVPPDL